MQHYLDLSTSMTLSAQSCISATAAAPSAATIRQLLRPSGPNHHHLANSLHAAPAAASYIRPLHAAVAAPAQTPKTTRRAALTCTALAAVAALLSR
jgi:hypothetical protein